MKAKDMKQISFRVDDETYKLFKDQVDYSGLNQTEFLVKTILKKEIISTDGLKEFVYELKKIGNNVNQISKKINSESYEIDPEEFKLVEKELKNIWQLLKQFLHVQK